MLYSLQIHVDQNQMETRIFAQQKNGSVLNSTTTLSVNQNVIYYTCNSTNNIYLVCIKHVHLLCRLVLIMLNSKIEYAMRITVFIVILQLC